MLRDYVKSLTPPIVRALPGVGRLAVRVRQHGFSGDYSSFDAALAAAGHVGYEDEAIVAHMLRSAQQQVTGAITNNTARVGFAMLATLGHATRCRVLDFGGGVGIHFDALRPWIKADVEWVVCETPLMVTRAGAARAGDGLRFVARLEPGEAFDVVLASGVLQYVRDPSATLADLCKRAPFTILDRVPLVDRRSDRLTVQRVNSGHRAAYPAWFFARSEFEARLSSLGLSVVMSWDGSNDVPYWNTMGADYRGMLLQQNAALSVNASAATP